MSKPVTIIQNEEWEDKLIAKLIEIAKEDYEPCFFAEMLIKVLYALQEETK